MGAAVHKAAQPHPEFLDRALGFPCVHQATPTPTRGSGVCVCVCCAQRAASSSAWPHWKEGSDYGASKAPPTAPSPGGPTVRSVGDLGCKGRKSKTQSFHAGAPVRGEEPP